MSSLISDIKNCKICLPHLIHGVNPVLSFSKKSRIIIIGQSPGSVVHKTGIAWDDKSGDRLRAWLGVGKTDIYNEELFALIPMGFVTQVKVKVEIYHQDESVPHSGTSLSSNK